ncbi:HK97-gp10 family putative phage morphogenesis protein [Pseudodesulfovibrio senegalensis]|nr:HK97-gp10 family putative phage morphogenesis protein [Pseudodesulfovibrio senegalensis]
MKMTTDINKALKQLNKAQRATERQLKKAMTKAAMQFEAESVKRSPIDEGHLQSSHRHKVEQNGSDTTAIVYIPTNSPASDYAIYMHEGTYTLGPTSLQKQGSVGVRVGKKYMERALLEEEDKIIATIVRELKRNLK